MLHLFAWLNEWGRTPEHGALIRQARRP
jgi:hypothetical protein